MKQNNYYMNTNGMEATFNDTNNTPLLTGVDELTMNYYTNYDTNYNPLLFTGVDELSMNYITIY